MELSRQPNFGYGQNFLPSTKSKPEIRLVLEKVVQQKLTEKTEILGKAP
jgi:hypothetical protein